MWSYRKRGANTFTTRLCAALELCVWTGLNVCIWTGIHWSCCIGAYVTIVVYSCLIFSCITLHWVKEPDDVPGHQFRVWPWLGCIPRHPERAGCAAVLRSRSRAALGFSCSPVPSGDVQSSSGSVWHSAFPGEWHAPVLEIARNQISVYSDNPALDTPVTNQSIFKLTQTDFGYKHCSLFRWSRSQTRLRMTISWTSHMDVLCLASQRDIERSHEKFYYSCWVGPVPAPHIRYSGPFTTIISSSEALFFSRLHLICIYSSTFTASKINGLSYFNLTSIQKLKFS